VSSTKLGRLERVELRNIWSSEASDFTPWLAREENLAVLAETLGIELECEAQERPVGPFRADILCKDLQTDRWVLIENQLERTDHRHLGQLMTYASGLEAVTIIWIAECFTDEHRSTLDWLNRITEEGIRFFGVEVELWKIGGSPAAPKFNIISKPNEWSQAIGEVARGLDEMSETRRLQRDYWEAFQRFLNEHKSVIRGNKKPQPQAWMSYPIGRVHFVLNAVMAKTKGQIRAELYISGKHAKSCLRHLKAQRVEIESEFGSPLVWEEQPSKRDCRIAIYLDNVNPEDKAEWQKQHQWLQTKLVALHRVFVERVSDLEGDQFDPLNDEQLGEQAA
jgi:Domain of unknown function (DUF4268)